MGIWNNIFPGDPITNPGTRWFQAVERFVMTLKVRFGDGAYIERPNEDMAEASIVIPEPPPTKRHTDGYLYPLGAYAYDDSGE
jgi:hypothetical protein